MTSLDRRRGEKIFLQALECDFTILAPAEIRFVPLYCLEERFAFVCGMAEESVQGRQTPVQHLYFLDASRGLHARDADIWSGLALIPRWMTRYPENFPRGHTEGALLQVEPDLVFQEVIECLAQMLHMIGASNSSQACRRCIPPWCVRSAP